MNSSFYHVSAFILYDIFSRSRFYYFLRSALKDFIFSIFMTFTGMDNQDEKGIYFKASISTTVLLLFYKNEVD